MKNIEIGGRSGKQLRQLVDIIKEELNKPEEINIKYFNEDTKRLEKIDEGDWIDLPVDSIVKITRDGEVQEINTTAGEWTSFEYKQGDTVVVGLGVAMQLPEGFEALMTHRSSTFRKTGLRLTSGLSVIDEFYRGDNDQWLAEFYATRDGSIDRHQRLLQFRIFKHQPEIVWNEVSKLDAQDRGGFGVTGR